MLGPIGRIGLLLAMAALASYGVLLILLRTGWAWKLAVDVPNDRSLHNRPTPRCGGWGILLPILTAFLILPNQSWRLAAAVILLAAISFIDDRQGLRARTRFAGHVVATFLVLSNVSFYSVGLLLVCAVLMLWSTNLYNFMDGADGLSGSMTVIGYGAYALAAQATDPALASLCIVISGAGLGFLCLNRPPARLFMGDAGSIPLGFLAGSIGILGWQSAIWPVWFPFLAFAPFFLDATVTLLRRLGRGERVWQAHREHFYQRLIQSGLSHRRVLIMEIITMITSSALALYLRSGSPLVQWTGILAALLIFGFLAWAIDRRWRRLMHSQRQSS